MMIKRIQFPQQATVNYIDSFLKAVREIRSLEGAELILDFSATTEISALSICFLCGLIDLAIEKNTHGRIVLPKNQRAARALKAVKLLAASKEKPKIKIAERMLQVRRIDGNNSAQLEEMLEILGYDLKIPQQASTSLLVLLTELLTNAMDHSGQKFCYVCLGAWGRSRSLHLSFLDFGMGMPQSLRTRYPQYLEDAEAIKMILTKGLTTRTDRVGGLGYQHIQEILRFNEGRFYIFSGFAKVVMKYDKREYSYKKARHPFIGTCVNMQFNLDGENLYEAIQETGKEYF